MLIFEYKSVLYLENGIYIYVNEHSVHMHAYKLHLFSVYKHSLLYHIYIYYVHVHMHINLYLQRVHSGTLLFLK